PAHKNSPLSAFEYPATGARPVSDFPEPSWDNPPIRTVRLSENRPFLPPGQGLLFRKTMTGGSSCVSHGSLLHRIRQKQLARLPDGILDDAAQHFAFGPVVKLLADLKPVAA